MITAAELPSPYDADGRIAIIERFLSEGRGLSFVIENFRRRNHVSYQSLIDSVADIQFIKRSPDSAPYRRELDLIASRAQPFEHEKSLFLHFSFEDPGKQVFQVLPDHPVQIPGIPQRISLWVNGQSTHALVLLFQNSDGREVRGERWDWITPDGPEWR